MDEYVCLLRGINVGGRNIKMAELKRCFEDVGLDGVKTYLQSGNVTFKYNKSDLDLLQDKLERDLSDRFNYPAKIFVLKKQDLIPIVSKYPFDSTNNVYQHYIIFLKPGLAAKLFIQDKDIRSGIDEIVEADRVLYWKVPKGMTLKSPFSKLLTRSEFKDFNTVRNINTLRKLLA